MRLTTLWQNRSPGDRHLSTYFCFAAVRLLLVFVPQLGYVHPDEFFQSVEVMTGEDWLLQCPLGGFPVVFTRRRAGAI